MKIRNLATALVVTTSTALAATVVPAQAHDDPATRTGNRNLASVLAADGNKFDHNWSDFDIVHRAVTTVLRAKPGSEVAVLTKGRQRVTAFLPTALDGAAVTVRVGDGRIKLRDLDRDDANARVIKAARNINQGNRQIAHGISRVLRPVDL